MTVQEIFNTKAVREIEQEILDIYFDNERRCTHNETEVYAIRRLIGIRKNVLNDMFVMDGTYKQLLSDFNEALKMQLKEMRKRTIALYQAAKDAPLPGIWDIEGMCYLGYAYSAIHPVQTMRAKKVWAVLNGTLDDFMSIYGTSAAGSFRITSRDSHIDSENDMLYGLFSDGVPDNFNEGLDRDDQGYAPHLFIPRSLRAHGVFHLRPAMGAQLQH